MSHADLNRALARRILQIRAETFGPDGATELARALGIPARTGGNYETGVAIPGAILLRFIEITTL